jgi:hypothetical protein
LLAARTRPRRPHRPGPVPPGPAVTAEPYRSEPARRPYLALALAIGPPAAPYAPARGPFVRAIRSTDDLSDCASRAGHSPADSSRRRVPGPPGLLVTWPERRSGAPSAPGRTPGDARGVRPFAVFLPPSGMAAFRPRRPTAHLPFPHPHHRDRFVWSVACHRRPALEFSIDLRDSAGVGAGDRGSWALCPAGEPCPEGSRAIGCDPPLRRFARGAPPISRP